MPRGYPPLTPQEVLSILVALGFHFDRHGRGDHDLWKDEPGRHTVTVDMGARQFDDYLIQSMIRQAGVSRTRFYGATPPTARKIGR